MGKYDAVPFNNNINIKFFPRSKGYPKPAPNKNACIQACQHSHQILMMFSIFSGTSPSARSKIPVLYNMEIWGCRRKNLKDRPPTVYHKIGAVMTPTKASSLIPKHTQVILYYQFCTTQRVSGVTVLKSIFIYSFTE
jgi:hypothetical protein